MHVQVFAENFVLEITRSHKTKIECLYYLLLRGMTFCAVAFVIADLVKIRPVEQMYIGRLHEVKLTNRSMEKLPRKGLARIRSL